MLMLTEYPSSCESVRTSMTNPNYGEDYARGYALSVYASYLSCTAQLTVCVQVIIALVKGQRLVLNPTTWRLLVPTDHNVKSLETLMDIVTDLPHLLAKPEVTTSSNVDHICT